MKHTIWIRAIPFVTHPATCNKTYTPELTTCYCDGVSLFPVEVYWTKQGSSKVLSQTPRLEVSAVEANDGTYVCHMRNDVGKVCSYPLAFSLFKSGVGSVS